MNWKPGLTRMRCLAALVAAATVSAGGATLATAPSSASGPSPRFYGDPKAPDISGLWLGSLTAAPGQTFAPGREPADGRPPTYWAPWPLPYTPAYQKIYDERVEAAKKGKQLGDLSAKCLPFGMPMVLVAKVYPDEIVQTPGEVTLFVYGAFPIVIWTDGRTHPKDLKSSYNGHSIGYWRGDTLFVDTMGVNGAMPLDNRPRPARTRPPHRMVDPEGRPRCAALSDDALRQGRLHRTRDHDEHLAPQDRAAMGCARRCVLLREQQSAEEHA